MNLPNKLTMLRIFMIPLFIACFFLPDAWRIADVNSTVWQLKYVIAAIVFLLAYITDTLDGNIARKRGLVTDFGKLMDPTADKLLTSAALIMLCKYEVMSVGNGLMPVFAFIIIAREIFISGVRQLAASRGIVIAANIIGKIKTTTQFFAILITLAFGQVFKGCNLPIDFILICISVLLTIWSGIDYSIKGRHLFGIKGE